MSMFTKYRMRGRFFAHSPARDSMKSSRISLTTKKMRTKKPNRIGKHWKNKPAWFFTDDYRLICNRAKSAGRELYRAITVHMAERQEWLCCICRKWMAFDEITFEHQDGRTKARRNDLPYSVQTGKAINGASHALCNQDRGSRRTKIYHYPQHEVAA